MIAGALLLVTGVNWVGVLRGCLRAVWQREQDPGNPLLLRIKDAAGLGVLGALGLVATSSSVLAAGAVGWTAERAGVHGGAGRVLLPVAGPAVGLLVDFLLLAFVLTRVAQVRPRRLAVVVAALIGAVGFDILKLLLTGYLQGVATKTVYGAFAVPVAVLLWINFMARLLLYCAAWTATAAAGQPRGTAGCRTSAPRRPETGPAAWWWRRGRGNR